MKATYKHKLFLYIFLLFALFTFGIVVFEQSRARKLRTEVLEGKLDVYANIVNTVMASGGEAIQFLPPSLRITIVDEQGLVVYDNAFEEIETLENHAQRPEIINAKETGTGTHIRTSASNNVEYLYYAKRFNNQYVRVALPYDVQVQHFLKSDNLFLYYILILFVVMLLLINTVTNRFDRMVRQLNDLTAQERTQKLKQEMTGNIAHELRTPVTSIRGYLELVLEQSMNAEKDREFLTKAYNQSIVLSELIHDMSLITKIEEVPHSFQLEPVGIKELLETLKTDLETSLQEKGIEMTWDVAENVVVTGNRNLLYSIFRNLTDNVIRYAGSDVRICISKCNEDHDFYCFSYSDTGVGIPTEYHLTRLFERFYRINDGRTRDTGGSGLGLSIVKNAVLFHKGSIVAKNKVGGGLEFLFKLPKK